MVYGHSLMTDQIHCRLGMEQGRKSPVVPAWRESDFKSDIEKTGVVSRTQIHSNVNDNSIYPSGTYNYGSKDSGDIRVKDYAVMGIGKHRPKMSPANLDYQKSPKRGHLRKDL